MSIICPRCGKQMRLVPQAGTPALRAVCADVAEGGCALGLYLPGMSTDRPAAEIQRAADERLAERMRL